MQIYLLSTQPLVFTNPDPRTLRLTYPDCTQEDIPFVLDNGRYLLYKILEPGIYQYEILDGIIVEESGDISVFSDECCNSNLDDIRQRTTRVYPGFPATTIKQYFEISCIPFDPEQVIKVEIQDLVSVVLQTLTPSREGEGIYRIDFEIEPGDYKDVWYIQLNPGDPITTIENFFTVLDRDFSTVLRFFSPYHQPPRFEHESLWGDVTSEVDLRAEIREILRGDVNCLPHGRKYILRRFERDEDENRIHCPCVKEFRGAGDPNCSHCKGEWFKFTEEIITAYISFKYSPVGDGGGSVKEGDMASPGIFFFNKGFLYCEHFVKPQDGDKVYMVATEEPSGEVILPVKRTKKWKMTSTFFPMSDFGRVEYYACFLEEETV